MSLFEDQTYDEENIETNSNGEIDIFALAQQGEDVNPMEEVSEEPEEAPIVTPVKAKQEEIPSAPRKSRTIPAVDDEDLPVKEEPKSTSNRRRRTIVEMDEEEVPTPTPVKEVMGGRRRFQLADMDGEDEAPAKIAPKAAQVAAPSGNKVSQDKRSDLLADLLADVDEPEPVAATTKVVARKLELLDELMEDVEKSVSEQYFDLAAKDGPVSVINRLLPTTKSIKALSDKEFTDIFENILFIVGTKQYESVTTGAKKIEMVDTDAKMKHTHVRVSRGSCVAAPSGVELLKGDIIACSDVKFVQRAAFTLSTFTIIAEFKKFDIVEIIQLANRLFLARGQ